MNPEIKAEWLDVLTNGIIPEPVSDYRFLSVGEPTECFRYGIGRDTNTSLLPESVINWAGLDGSMGRLPTTVDHNGIELNYLTELNDYGATFSEIADIIEEYF